MRFIARKEHHCALFQDTETHRTIKLNILSYSIVEALSRLPLGTLLESYSSEEERKAIIECAEAMRELGMLDERFGLNTKLIPPADSPDCLSAPVRVYLNLTNRCNLQCRHCVNSSSSHENREIPLDLAISLIDEMSESGVFELVIGGGEVFLYPGILDVVHHAGNKGIAIGLTTNGLLIDRDLCRKLSSVRLKYLSVSIDGAGRETHELVRGPGSFEKAIRGLENLKEHSGQEISLHFVVMKHNLRDISQLFKMAETLGCDIGIDFAKPGGRILKFPELLLERDEYVSALELIFTRLIPESSRKVFLPVRCYPSVKETRYFRNFGCGAANTCCSVGSDGYVSPCNFLTPVEQLDNIRQKSLRAIWRGNAEFTRMRALKQNESCATCRFYPNCRGGCRANVSPSSPPNSPDPCCLQGTSFAQGAELDNQ